MPFAGVVLVGLVFAAPAGAVVDAVPPFVPEVLAGVAAGVAEGGSDVNGVGSGGNGFDRMPATSWSMPSVLSPLRYLYQVVRLSCHTGFCDAKLESVPARATARAYASIMRSTS